MSCCTKPRSFHALSSRFSYFEERKFFCKGSTFIYLKVSDLILNESIIQEDEEAMETFRSVIKEYNSFQAFENPLNTAASTTDHCVVFPLNLHIFSANLFRKEDFVNIDRFLMALENGFLEFPHGKASSFRPSNEYFSTTNSIRKTGIPITESTAKSLTVKKEFIDELSTICKQYLNSDDFTAMTALLKSGRLDRLLLALGKYSNLGILSEKILRYLLKFLKNPVHLNCTSKATKHISSQAWNSLLCNIISELPAFAAIRTLYIILLMKYRSNCQLMDVDRKLSRVESERRLTTAETERRLSTWVTIGNMVFKECRNVNALIIFMMSKNIPLSMNSIEKLFIQFITYYPRKSVEAHLLQEVLKQPNIHRDHPYNESPFSIFEGYYKERLFHSPASIPVNIYNVMLVQSFWVSSRERLDYFCKMMVQTNKMNPFAHLIMLLYAYESRAENNDLKLKFQVFFNSLVEEKKKKLEFISDNDNLLIIPFFLERLLSVVEHLGLSDWNQKLAELLPPYSSIINERSSG